MNAFWSNLSLRTQISILSSLLLAITISITAFININNIHDDLKKDLVKRNLALGHNLSYPLSYELVREEFDTIEKNLLIAAEFPEIDSIKLIDTSGIIISNIFKTEQREIRVSYSQLNIDNIENIRSINQPVHTFYNDHLEIIYPLKTSTVLGWLNLSISYAEINTIYHEIITKNILAALFIIFINVVFLIFVFTRLTQNIHHAINFAEKLNTHSPQKTKEKGGSSELNQLFFALNSTATRLITQHQEIEKNTLALMKSQAESEAANKAKSEFLSSMSHELRTPLSSIIGTAQLFKFDDSLSKEQHAYADNIHQAGNHLLSLINDTLDLTRIESGNMEVSLEDIAIIKAVEECLLLISPLIESSRVKLNVDLTQLNGLHVKVDYTRFKQVLLNLFSNAIKYNSSGGLVSIYCNRSNENSIRINIQDTGAGINEDQMAYLYQPFNRLGAELGTIEGTGIGLVITKNLVELMGGVIGVESTLGKGSIFWVEFKIASVDNQSDVVEENKSELKLLLSQSKILVAEDNLVNQMILKQLLVQQGLQVDTANDGAQAWDLLQSDQYDMLLTDINMPVMDGYELITKIRQHEQQSGKHLPVIAVTANAMTKDQNRCMESGMDGFIRKPIDLTELQNVLHQWLKTQE